MELDDSTTMPVPENSTPSPRPTVPPKPKSTPKDEKETPGSGTKSGTKTTVGTQVHFVKKTSPATRTTPGSIQIQTTSSPTLKNGQEAKLSPNNVEVIEVGNTSPFLGSERSRSLSATTIKPALPPKPTASALLSPRKGVNSISQTPDIKRQTGKPVVTPGHPSEAQVSPNDRRLSSPPFAFDLNGQLTDLNNSNRSPNETTTTSVSQVTNLNQSQRLNSNKFVQLRTVQTPFSPLTEIQKAESRKKTTSLGRNVDISTSSANARNPAQIFFKASPLDLSTTVTSRPRSMDHFGRTISFAPNSPIPPPPPPRIKRKFSSTSPNTATLPESPPPVPPVYAKVDKEKKWEIRRQKQAQQQEVSKTSNEQSLIENLSEPDHKDNSSHDKSRESDPEVPINNSWLGKFLDNKAEDGLDCAGASSSQNISETVQQISTEQCMKSPQIQPCSTSDDDELTPTESNIPENNSFLFSIVEKEAKKEVEEPSKVIPDLETSTSHEFQRKPSDESFEDICESKLESIELNGNVNETVSAVPDTHKKLTLTQDTSERLLDIDAGKLLESVDSKIQTLQSLLSTISNSSADSYLGQSIEGNMNGSELNSSNLDKHNKSGTRKLSTTGGSESSTTEIEFGGKSTDADLVNEIISQKFTNLKMGTSCDDTKPEVTSPAFVPPITVGLLSRDSFRRRSWNCSENTSSPTSESSASSSSSSIRDRAGSMTHSSGWLDAGGDISTGALGDTENSDVSTQVLGPPNSFRPYAGSGGSLSRRKRTTMASIFSSFGKGMASSSSSNSPSGTKPKRKDKTKLFEIRHSPKIKGHTSSSAHWPGPSPLMKSMTTPPKKTVSMPQFHPPPGDEYYHVKSAMTPQSMGSNAPKSMTPGSLDDDDGERAEICSITSNTSVYDDILADLSPKEKKAFYVARELLTSERTFVDVLNLLTIDFPQALREAGELNRQPVISDADLQSILGELPTLKSVNIILLGELEERIRGWKSNPKVADIIVKTGPFLKHYSTYIKDFEKISHFFGTCRQRNPKFSKTVMDFEGSERCQKLCLMHYMLKPVQRMPQYPLLLEDYLKNLDQDSADFKDTIRAITIVREVAEHANDAIRLQANADKLIQLQNRLNHSVILKPDRQLVKEGELQKVCRKELQPRYFGLMNDCLLCMMYNASTGSNRDLKLRYELPLTGMQVLLSSSEDYANEFTVISTTRSFNLLARSGKEREEWMKALNQAIRDNIKKRSCSTPDMDKEFELGKVAPVWIADARVSMCQICTAEYTITFRRHHCRACGKVVCGNCSRNEAPLHYQNLEAARVCDDCYQFLLEEFDKENQQNHSGEVEVIRARFKKATPKVTRAPKRSIPARLEINSSVGSQVSGYLNWRERKSWKRRWFVLVDRVLLVCAASEDVAASKSIPILGYDVEIGTEKTYEGVDGQLVFKLTHSGQSPMIFQAENASSLEKWVGAMKEATILT